MSGGTVLVLSLFAGTVAYAAYLPSRLKVWSAAAVVLVLAALLTLSVGLFTRGFRGQHWPLTNRFEFALSWVWAILVFNLLLEHIMESRSAGVFVLPVALVLTLWAANRPGSEQTIRPLSPALQTMWFPLHVGASAVAYGAFSVAAGLGLMLLTGDWLRQRQLVVSADATRFPPSAQIEYYIWRLTALGFPWLTLAMLAGAIWAQIAWGRYWDWDPKESWALITWLTYLILLHGRTLRGWGSRRLAWLSIVGFGAALFTFFGVDWLVDALRLDSVHIF